MKAVDRGDVSAEGNWRGHRKVDAPLFNSRRNGEVQRSERKLTKA
jgi:hypothetical protein